MKKSQSVLLALTLALSMGMTAFAEVGGTITRNAIPENVHAGGVQQEAVYAGPTVMYGKVTAVSEKRVEVKAHSNEDVIVLNLSDATYLIDALSGKKLQKELKVGDAVAAYYGPATTRSLPPQSSAIAIIANIPQDMGFPFYAKVEAVQTTESGMKVTTNGGTKIITLTKDMPIAYHKTEEAVTINDLIVGTELVLWYQVMGASMPAVATARKAVVLSIQEEPVKDKMIVSTQAGVISLNGKELAFTDELVYEKDGKTFLPLRVLVEALGYEVNWIADMGAVELKKDASSATLRVGSTEYGINKARLVLDMAPEIKGEKTYVPVAFFEQALNVEVVINQENV